MNMDYKNVEFLRDGEPSGWEIKFELPKCLHPENLEPIKVNKIELKDGLWLSEDKATNIDFNNIIKHELGEIQFNLTDHSDKVEDYKSIRKFVDEWIERYGSDFNEQVVNFFTLFEHDDEHSDDTNMSYRLKKPISEMTDEEIVFLRDVLDNFVITDLSSWGL